MQFKAFISYSRAADGKLAPALQASLQQFGKAWYQKRTMRVFRDEAVLSANPALWLSIERALEETEYFLLLASSGAASSAWIGREVDWWLTHRSIDRMLVLITEGEVVWNRRLNDFDWTRTNVLPAQLKQRFTEEPRHVDLRWAKGLDQLSIRHLRFRGAILDIVATLLDRDKDELDSDEIRQHRRTKRLAWSGVVSLFVLTVLLIGTTWFALAQRNEAIRQRDRATELALATQSALTAAKKAYDELLPRRKKEHDKSLAPIPKIR